MSVAAIQPIASGVKTFGDGDSWMNWWLFPRVTDEQLLKDFFYENEIVRWHDGPGLPFSRSPGWRHSRSYTLVTQFAGYDV